MGSPPSVATIPLSSSSDIGVKQSVGSHTNQRSSAWEGPTAAVTGLDSVKRRAIPTAAGSSTGRYQHFGHLRRSPSGSPRNLPRSNDECKASRSALTTLFERRSWESEGSRDRVRPQRRTACRTPCRAAAIADDFFNPFHFPNEGKLQAVYTGTRYGLV